MKKNEKLNNKLIIVLIILLSCIAITIYIPVIKEVLSGSGHHDFQWSPAKLVFERVNHYNYLLEDKTEKIKMSQYGEYLHGLYILFYPYTLLNWTFAKVAWMITNIFLLFFIPFKLCKKFQLSNIETIIIIFFFSCCVVSKVQIITGQQTLLILLFFSIPFFSVARVRNILSGISYFKYTIGYVLFFFYLSSKQFKNAIFSLLPAILGWIIYGIITKTNLLDLVLQPFQLAIKNQIIGQTENNMPKNKFIFSILEHISFFDFKFKSIFFLTLSLIFSAFIVFKISKLKDKLLQLACLAIVTLIFFPHYPHDYVLLLPLLIYSIKNFYLLTSKISFIITIYFLQFFKAFQIYFLNFLYFLNFKTNNINIFEYSISYINILILLFLLLINLKIVTLKNYKFFRIASPH